MYKETKKTKDIVFSREEKVTGISADGAVSGSHRSL